MPTQAFAFPKERKEPFNDAHHVRNAIARFDQVRERSWRELVKGGTSGKKS